MESIKLNAVKRSLIGKKVKELRKQGKIPAVLYSQGKVGENLTLNLKEFINIFKKAGSSSLVDLTINDKNPIKILIYQPQYDPLTDKPIHVDLYKIRMDEEITTKIPLEFVGEAPAVKELEGNLIKNKDEVEVKCLPGNLIPKIQVDISALKSFDNSILIKDLKIPQTIKIQDEQEETVAIVNPPISEEKLKAMEEEAAKDAEKEGIEKMEAQAEAEKATKEEKKTEGEEGVKEGAETKPEVHNVEALQSKEKAQAKSSSQKKSSPEKK